MTCSLMNSPDTVCSPGQNDTADTISDREVPWDQPKFHDWVKVSQVYVRVRKHLADELAPLGVDVSHHDIMANVLRYPGITQSQLADKLLVGRSNLSMLLPDLEKRGLVRRDADPGDRRVKMLYLTDKGQTLIFQALHIQTRVMQETLTDVPEALCAQVGEAMQRVLDHLDRG